MRALSDRKECIEDVLATGNRFEWGESRAMTDVVGAIERVAATPRTTVLVLGESGTGKEVVAREIHRRSARCDKPFVAVNCAGFADGLLEADLFGHAPGAFTGALPGGRKGLFEAAHGGSILLDEIGELDLNLQARLLRVLQERTIRPVGGTQDKAVDVRILAATNRDLGEMVGAGKFREDLYYRLNVLSIRVPALRDRIGDVPLLARLFVGEIAREIGCAPRGLTNEASTALAQHRWPGNVRELRNVIERAVLLARDGWIGTEHLGLEENKVAQGSASKGLHLEIPDCSLRSVERALIERVLGDAAGNRSQAARLLGVNRTTLYNKMRAYGL
jgi:transcriptional regulator with PAS, ATPase and Fis domain